MPTLSPKWPVRLLLAATIGMVLSTGCWHTSPTPAPRPVEPAPVFVGNDACAPCHPSEFDRHRHGRHAQTLRMASRQSLGPLSPPIGKIPGTDFVLAERDAAFVIAAPDQSDSVAPLKYALGSGKTGMTYVFPVENEKLVEAHMSYFPPKKKWYITPGQERIPADVIGSVHPKADGQKCLLCHAVTLPPESLTVEKRFFGVGCESCHGSGGTHVAAMHAGTKGAIGMEKMGRWPATRLNALCGKCHGTLADAQAAHKLDATNRLQAYGLMQSQCYQQSHDTLSCVTCHEPHTDVVTRPKTYEAVCLTCHSASGSHPAPAAEGKPCPINPKEGCIGCHMPLRQAIPHTQLPTFMADHYIRAHR